MHAHGDVERHEQGVLVDSQFRREDRCDAIRPVDPRLPFGPRQLEYVGNSLCPVDQFPFELRQAHLVGLRLDHLVDRASLQ